MIIRVWPQGLLPHPFSHEFIVLPETSPKPLAVADWESARVAESMEALRRDHPSVRYEEPAWVGKVLRGEEPNAY